MVLQVSQGQVADPALAAGVVVHLAAQTARQNLAMAERVEHLAAVAAAVQLASTP